MNTQSSNPGGTAHAHRQTEAGTPESGCSYIEHALELKSTVGTVCAIEFLKAHDVSPETILQVATTPGVRISNRTRL